MGANPFPQPAPSDIYEVDLLVQGTATPYSTYALSGTRYGTAAGPAGTIFVPSLWTGRRDHSGALLATLVCTVAGSAGALSAGTTLYTSAGAAGTTSGAARISDGGRFARELAQILGTAYQAVNGNLITADLTSLGGALALIRATSLRSLDQAFADAASDTLDDLEREFGLATRPDLPQTDRRTRLVAKVRAYIAATAQNIANAIRAYDSTATVHENVPDGSRAPFQFGITLSDAIYDSVIKLAAIAALIEQMKPAHTKGNLGTKKGFYTNEATSLTNRTLI